MFISSSLQYFFDSATIYVIVNTTWTPPLCVGLCVAKQRSLWTNSAARAASAPKLCDVASLRIFFCICSSLLRSDSCLMPLCLHQHRKNQNLSAPRQRLRHKAMFSMNQLWSPPRRKEPPTQKKEEEKC